MEENELTILHHCRSLEIEWEYLNEFDLEDEDEDEDAQMEWRSHPTQQHRMEDERYVVLMLWIVRLEVEERRTKTETLSL